MPPAAPTRPLKEIISWRQDWAGSLTGKQIITVNNPASLFRPYCSPWLPLRWLDGCEERAGGLLKLHLDFWAGGCVSAWRDHACLSTHSCRRGSRGGSGDVLLSGSFSAFSYCYFFMSFRFILPSSCSSIFVCLLADLSEWVVGGVASSLTAVWEPGCQSRSSALPPSFWSQPPLI